jgi:hypothetical protein
VAINSSSQRLLVQQQHVRSGALNYTCATFNKSSDPISFNDLEQIRTWHCQREKGREPAMPPPTTSHSATTKLSTVADNNNCLHNFCNLRKPERECRHPQQTPTKTSHNKTQCNSAATDTCQRPSRWRYSSIYTVDAVFQH